jgi:hypothetical protein
MRKLIIGLLFLSSFASGQMMFPSILSNSVQPPLILTTDGNTVAWFAFDDLTTITKDGFNIISSWNDKTALGHNLTQSTTASRPLWTLNGVSFDGYDDKMYTSTFSYVQPEYIYCVVSQVWDHGKTWDGYTFNSGTLDQYNPQPLIVLRTTNANTNLGSILIEDNKFYLIKALANGASSKISVNSEYPHVGSVEAVNMNGITLGSGVGDGIAGYPEECVIKEFIARDTIDTPHNDSLITNYLMKKYSTSIATIPSYNITFTLTSTGNGTGVSTLQLSTPSTAYVNNMTLDGTARFYTDAAGTANESQSVVFWAGKTVYIRVPSGTAHLKFYANNVDQIVAWTSGTNAAKWAGDLSQFPNLYYVSALGQTDLTTNLSLWPKMTYLYITDPINASGKIDTLKLATYLRITTTGDPSGDISGLTALQLFWVLGVHSITYSTVANATGLSYLAIPSTTTLTSENVNQLLADFWLNKDAAKPLSFRTINLVGSVSTGSPTGQGITDKNALKIYHSPTPPGTASVWTVTTR